MGRNLRSAVWNVRSTVPDVRSAELNVHSAEANGKFIGLLRLFPRMAH
ncbi:MAG: hypothetical protein PUC85_02890 [bacterium]|nr:hypothetical protein [Parabacteroides sp.]MCI7009491.1 hypothetical protein [Parabacteroides sp.]MDD6079110.1 hypothetical protein [bacterium]